jgi:lipoprotein-releasing system permease protein
MSTLFIARRFLQFQPSRERQQFIPFITSIAIIGIALGVMALIIALTILGGFEKELKEKVIGFSTHIQVTGFQNQILVDWREAEKRIQKNFPLIKSISPFIAKEGMVSFGDATDGIMVKGIEPQTDLGIKKYLVEGTFTFKKFQDGLYSCVIGKKLLRKLNAQLNDTVLVFGLPGTIQDITQPTIAGFVVTGVYESGMSEYDDVYFYIDIQSAQQLFSLWDGITGFDITVKDLSRVNDVAKGIVEELGYPYYARTVFQLYRNLFTWIQLQKEPIPLILGLIIGVAAVNIIGTLLMLVLEKRKQIGVLRSLGASQKDIKKIFLLQGAVIAVVGTAMGNILSFFICWLQLEFKFFSLPSSIYFMNSVPIDLEIRNFALVSFVSIVLSILAAYIPARLAAKLDPIRAIRMN